MEEETKESRYRIVVTLVFEVLGKDFKDAKSQVMGELDKMDQDKVADEIWE